MQAGTERATTTQASSQRGKGVHSRALYCGNNSLHRSLKANGGTRIFGTNAECFKKGYGVGYNAPVKNMAEFIAEWARRYKPYIVQKIYYGDGAVPPGYQRALLSQSLARGFGLGRVARARKMSRKSGGKSTAQSKQKPTLPLKASSRMPSRQPSTPRL